MSVAEILQTLAESRANGMLRILAPNGSRYVLLQNGQIIQVLRSTENDSFLQILAAHGALPHMPSSMPADGSLMDLLAQLLADARISKQRIQQILLLQTEEELLTVIGWHHGSFAFYEADQHADVERRLSGWQGFGVAIDIRSWWSQHRNLFAQWDRMANSIDQRAVLRLSEQSTINYLESWPERSVVGLVDGARTFAAVVEEAELAPVRCQLLLASWVTEGELEIIPASDLPHLPEACLPGQPGRAARLATAMFGTPQASQGEAILQRALTDIRQPTEAAEYLMAFALWRVEDGLLGAAERLMRQALAKDDRVEWRSRWWSCCVASGQTQNVVEGLIESGREAVTNQTPLVAAVRAQQARFLAPLDARVNNFVITIQTDDALRQDHQVCHGCGKQVIATATDCPHCRAELLQVCADCGRPIAAVDDCCLGCQAGLVPERPLRLVGSFVGRLRAELSDLVLAQAGEALRLQAEGDLLMAVRFWRQVADVDEVSSELRELIGLRIEQLQLWHARQVAMGHLQRGRTHVARRQVVRGCLAYRRAQEWLPAHDAQAPLLLTEKRHAQRVCALTGVLYVAALFFIGLTVQELWRDRQGQHNPDQRPDQRIVLTDPTSLDRLLTHAAGSGALSMSGNESQLGFAGLDLAGLGLAMLGRSARWSFSAQEWLLNVGRRFAHPRFSQAAADRLRLLRVQALAAYDFLPRHGANEQSLWAYLEKYAGAPEAQEVWQRLQQVRAQSSQRSLLLQQYEVAASRDDYAAALALLPALRAAEVDLAAAGYLFPVLVTTPNPNAVLRFASQRVAEANQDGMLGWWADPVLVGDRSIDFPGWEKIAVPQPDLRQGMQLSVVPEPIAHVYADLEQPVVAAWQLSDDSFLSTDRQKIPATKTGHNVGFNKEDAANVATTVFSLQTDEDMLFLHFASPPDAPLRSTTWSAPPQTTATLIARRYVTPLRRTLVAAAPKGAARFVDQGVLQPWSSQVWELIDLDGHIVASWPRHAEPHDAPIWWRRSFGGHMIAWNDGDGLRIGPWRRNLYRLNLTDAVIAGPMLSQTQRHLFALTADDVVHAVDPMALQVLWRQPVGDGRVFAADIAGVLPVLADDSLQGLDVAGGTQVWSVAAERTDKVMTLRDPTGFSAGVLVHANTAAVTLREPESGLARATIPGRLLAATWSGADPELIVAEGDVLRGYSSDRLQWQTAMPSEPVAAWIRHDTGLFAVCTDGRWLSYHLPEHE